MHLIITNKYKSILSDLNPDKVNVLEGSYDIRALTDKVKGFSYDKIILDITSIENYLDENVLKQLTALNPSDMVIYLDNTKECVSEEFLKRLVDLGMYNFTRNVKGVKYLLSNPNTIENVKNIIDSSTKQEEVQEEKKEIKKEIDLDNKVEESNVASFSDESYANTDFTENDEVEEKPKVYDFSYKPEDNGEIVGEKQEEIIEEKSEEPKKKEFKEDLLESEDSKETNELTENDDLVENADTKETDKSDNFMSNGFIEPDFSDVKPETQIDVKPVETPNEPLGFDPFPSPLTDAEAPLTDVEVPNIFSTELPKEEPAKNVMTEEDLSVEEPKSDEVIEEQEEVYESSSNKKKRIIGIKNITEHAGSTSLIYLFYKELIKKYETMAFEIDLLDLTLFRNPAFISTTKSDIKRQIERYSTVDYILIDLNDATDYSYCDEVLFLVEPSTIKLLKLRLKDKEIFEKLKAGKIILNKSLLSDKDIKDFEAETKTKVFYNMPPINDRNEKQEEIVNLMKKIDL